MKRAAIATAVLILLAVPALIASGPGGGGMSTPSPMPMQQKSPHEQAVDFYNNAERRIDGLAKLHDEMKAAAVSDPQKATKLQGKLSKGLENAAADLERAVKNDPTLYEAYSELGFTYRKMGKFKESLEAYDTSLRIQPNYTPALEYRAEAYLGLNRIDDARKTYTELFSADRPRADALLIAMKSFVAARQADAAGLDPAQLEAFAKWVGEREIIHGQTAALTAQTSTFRSW